MFLRCQADNAGHLPNFLLQGNIGIGYPEDGERQDAAANENDNGKNGKDDPEGLASLLRRDF